MKKILKVLAGIIGLLFLAYGVLYLFGTADLRNDSVKKDPQVAKAKVLMQEMAESHMIENWDSISTYTVRYQEEMYGFLGKFSNPFPEEKSLFDLSYIPNTYDGRLTFVNGKNEGKSWGIQSWKTYSATKNSEPVFADDANITFWVPTYQYFIEFPKRILNANAFGYVGEQTINNVMCEGVIASWNTIEPQRDIDQYLIWLNKATKRIVKLEYTVRDQYNFVVGAAYFNDYKDFDGILLPTKLPVGSNLLAEGELLHQMDIINFTKNTLTQKELRPIQNLKAGGDEK